jgi:ribosomal protein L37AE/L43A
MPKKDTNEIFCSKCLQPMSYKQYFNKCKKCHSLYEKGTYKEHKEKHKYMNDKKSKYWGFDIILD